MTHSKHLRSFAVDGNSKLHEQRRYPIDEKPSTTSSSPDDRDPDRPHLHLRSDRVSGKSRDDDDERHKRNSRSDECKEHDAHRTREADTSKVDRSTALCTDTFLAIGTNDLVLLLLFAVLAGRVPVEIVRLVDRAYACAGHGPRGRSGIVVTAVEVCVLAKGHGRLLLVVFSWEQQGVSGMVERIEVSCNSRFEPTRVPY